MENSLISIGAGISIGVLIIRLITLGPLLKDYFWQGEFLKILVELGFGIGLQGLGTLLAFLALLKYYKPLAVRFIDRILLTIAGVVIKPEEALAMIEAYINVPINIEPYLLKILWGISLARTVMLIVSLIYGAGFIKLGKAALFRISNLTSRASKILIEVTRCRASLPLQYKISTAL